MARWSAEHFWWGSVFLVAVPVMVLLLVLGPILLPEFRAPAAGRLDLPSVLLSLGAVLAVIHGLKQLARGGLGLLPRQLLMRPPGSGQLHRRSHHGAAVPGADQFPW